MTLSNAASAVERVLEVRVIEELAYVSDNAANPTVWTSIAEPDDELAQRILAFLREHAGLPAAV